MSSTWFTRCATALVMVALASANALADPIPPGGQSDRLKVIGFSGLGGHYGAFKMALNHPALTGGAFLSPAYRRWFQRASWLCAGR